nr:bucky ball-like [Nothobranchius furzeri]
MEAATSTFHHPYGLGPGGPHPNLGAESSQRPPEPAPGPGPPRPDGQHHKPFFYVQPPQPYLPMQGLQWPVPMAMPVSYNPYYGYPGLGFGLPMMPHYQPSPYLDPPGFVVPHTHLHLMDYRRVLNPQYYQAMAYHARRFRYQHNSPSRHTTSSEVQTEPLVSAQRTSTPMPSERPDSAAHSTSTGQLLSPVSDVQKQNPSMELQKVLSPTPPKGSFVIQTEELRIECCTTPVGLQLLHDAADMSHSFPQGMVQHNSLVLQDEGLHVPADQSEQELQVCPDILLVGKPSTGEVLPPEEPRNQVVPVNVSSSLGFPELACPKSEDTGDVSPENFYLKGVHLPFDPKYLDELRKMESTVWSAEETLISSPELLIQNCFANSDDLLLSSEVVEPEMLMDEPPTKEIIHVIEMFPLEEDDLQEIVSTLESEMVSDSPKAELIGTEEVALMDRSPPEANGDQPRLETNDHPDTSFESLPTYLPSSSWLSDFDHIYHSTKTPPAPRKQIRPQSCCGSDGPKRRRKLDTDHREQPATRKPKERYKPKGKVDCLSFSDHDCSVSRNANENSFSPYASKKEQLCSRCLKRRDCTSGSGCDGRSLKRKAVPLQQWNHALLPTCEACRSHTKRPLRGGSSPDPRRNTEEESSGNSSCHTSPQWRPAGDSVKSKGIGRRPAAGRPKLREKNCFCGDSPRQSAAWERLRHCPHGNTIQEVDENCSTSVSLPNRRHRWQTAKPWSDVIPNMMNEATSLHSFNHKTTQPQPQGTRTKDTRC